jgi:hypothetical protein
MRKAASIGKRYGKLNQLINSAGGPKAKLCLATKGKEHA